MTREHLRGALSFYRAKLQKARETSQDVEETSVLMQMVHRLFQDVEAFEAEEESQEQHDDRVLGWVRQRLLEFGHVEELLVEDRARGVAELAAILEDIHDRFEAALEWEKKEKKAS